ncbi:hypothetical protein [Lentibacillus sediminis]|uniref:hypothetical protein n=1 Tax=Lentibacillus sediminis TaxID=1940529 RepID=UPI000C1B855E|nr:hypothetical protein [Lentibacillus sediminis]
MAISINAVAEYNDKGCLIYCTKHTGAFVRGKTIDEAVAKFDREITQYTRWLSGDRHLKNEKADVRIIQEKKSSLRVEDADSDVIFAKERLPLSGEEYDRLKNTALKSAADSNTLYHSIPDKQYRITPPRKTFYGEVPCTADEIYTHTNNVTNYYAGEIGVRMDNLSDIAENRILAISLIESLPDFLSNPVHFGSYDEEWSLGKVLRRFIWHDRTHAKSMYRMAAKVWGDEKIENPFCFEI